MRLDDPARPFWINKDHPTWLTAPSWAVPGLNVRPEGKDHVRVDLVVIHSVITRVFGIDELPELVRQWYNDPEETLRRRFFYEPPRQEKFITKGSSAPKVPSENVKSEKSIEELDL